MEHRAPEDAVILIPSLEPDERLPAYVQRLSESGFGHIVVVNDGSGESYEPVFRKIAEIENTVVLRHEINRGKGVALKTGYQYILDTWSDVSGVITADADGQHTVEDCTRLAEKLKEGKRALYLGSRDFTLPGVPPKSRTGNRITSRVFQLLYGQYLPDTQTGLRAFRREELPFMIGVEGERFEYEMKVLIACSREKIPMIPVTIETVYEDNNEGTHFHPVRDSVRIYKVILGSFIRFMGVSLLCFVIDQLAAAVLREWLLPLLGLTAGSFWNIQISGWGARVLSAVINFRLNRDLVFRVRGSQKNAAWRYAALCVGIICASNLGVWLLSRIGMAGWLAKMLMDTALYIVSYRIQENWVFREDR